MRLLPIIVCGLSMASGLVIGAESSDSSERSDSRVTKIETPKPELSSTTAPTDPKNQGAPPEKLPEAPKSRADFCRDHPC